MNKESNKVLLESGTNELEIVELSIGNQTFGMNVLKVREVIRLQKVIPASVDYFN